MTYAELLGILKDRSEEKFRLFQKKFIFTKAEILGVRTPVLRKIAKSVQEEVFAFPDEYYEVTFIKLAVAARLPYEKLIERLDGLVLSIDNWATCDTFKPVCIQKNKDLFLPYIERYFCRGEEFFQRFALVSLLNFYIEEKYLSLIERYLSEADTEKYYVYMSAAWLTAEVLVKFYPQGVAILQSGILDKKTHNKAIQKGIESFRLNQEQKAFLKTLKIK